MRATLSLISELVGSPLSKAGILPRHPYTNAKQVFAYCSVASCSCCRGGWNRLPKTLIRAAGGEASTRKGLSNLDLGTRHIGNEQAVTCARQDSPTMERVEARNDQLQLTHEVSLDIAAPVELVWGMWTDLPNAPHWMRWIDRVELLEDATTQDCMSKGLNSLSRWICSTPGFEVSWVAQIESLEVTPPRRFLRWVTISGLQSVGEVSFTESSQGTRVELKIDHAVPQSLGQLMTCEALKSLIQATLQSDLERFNQYILAAVGTVNPSK